MLLFGALQASCQTTHQQAYWIRLHLRGELPKKWSWHFQLDERRFIRPDRQMQFISHAQMYRKWGERTETSAGGSYSVVNALPEWRLFQELHYTLPMGPRWRLRGRFRTEQRWLQQPSEAWRWRFRWRIRGELNCKMAEKWLLRLSEEAMWHTDGFDQNRIYAAVERTFSRRVSVEIGFLKLCQKQAGRDWFERDILRSTFYLKV
jgi:hypothetical protein